MIMTIFLKISTNIIEYIDLLMYYVIADIRAAAMPENELDIAPV